MQMAKKLNEFKWKICIVLNRLKCSSAAVSPEDVIGYVPNDDLSGLEANQPFHYLLLNLSNVHSSLADVNKLPAF